MIKCQDCNAEIKGDRWSKTKSGWFFQKNGNAFCPNHTPDWVEEWRNQK